MDKTNSKLQFNQGFGSIFSEPASVDIKTWNDTLKIDETSNRISNHPTSQSKFKNDECYIDQFNSSNKSIFGYMTDNNMFVNKNECLDITPTFLNYIPSGTPKQNVDIENELRGAMRNNSRCTSCKYTGDHSLASEGFSNKTLYNEYPNNKHVCEDVYTQRLQNLINKKN